MGRGGGMGNPVNVGIAVQADWENREFISNISLNVRRLFDFLLRFGQFWISLTPPRSPCPRACLCGSGPALHASHICVVGLCRSYDEEQAGFFE
jgi:hypothetical protein